MVPRVPYHIHCVSHWFLPSLRTRGHKNRTDKYKKRFDSVQTWAEFLRAAIIHMFRTGTLLAFLSYTICRSHATKMKEFGTSPFCWDILGEFRDVKSHEFLGLRVQGLETSQVQDFLAATAHGCFIRCWYNTAKLFFWMTSLL